MIPVNLGKLFNLEYGFWPIELTGSVFMRYFPTREILQIEWRQRIGIPGIITMWDDLCYL